MDAPLINVDWDHFINPRALIHSISALRHGSHNCFSVNSQEADITGVMEVPSDMRR